jgi:hypothetical protein
MSEIKTPPVAALMLLKQMQEIQKKSQDLEMEFLMKSATLAFEFGMTTDEITHWIKNGRSDV